MIKISNLTFKYPTDRIPDTYILNQINFTIREGETVGVMGANGSGKTTLARCLNGLLLPTMGDVWVDNMNTREEENLIEIRRRIGMVFQNPENQIVSTTVEREIAFGLENIGMPHQEMHERVDEMLAQFDLVKYRQHPPHLLSGGEMQRLALASVMAMSPKYLIFDEPTSLLDFASRKTVLKLLSSLHKKNTKKRSSERISILFITQFPEETLLCDRLIILHLGQIVFNEKPSEVFQNVDLLKKMGVDLPVECEVSHYLKLISDGRISFNTSDFLPII